MTLSEAICGIYKIQSKVTGKTYVGSSRHIKRRWQQHVSQLRSGSHHSIRLQESWNQYGEDSFVFFVLEEVEESQLVEVEQRFIEQYESWKDGYNTSRIATGQSLAQLEEMKICVDLSPYWPEGLSVNAAYEELLMQGMKVDRRTLSSAKTGTLTKSEYLTLIRLRDWVRKLTGNKKLTTDDLFKVENND